MENQVPLCSAKLFPPLFLRAAFEILPSFSLWPLLLLTLRSHKKGKDLQTDLEGRGGEIKKDKSEETGHLSTSAMFVRTERESL